MRGIKAIWIGSGPSVRRSDPGPTTAVRPPSHLALAVESFGSSARRVPLLACPAVRDKGSWCGHDRAWPSIISWRDALHYLLEGRAPLSPGGTRCIISWRDALRRVRRGRVPLLACPAVRDKASWCGHDRAWPSIILWGHALHYLLAGRAALSSGWACCCRV